MEEIIQKEKTKQENGWKNYHEDKRESKTIALHEITAMSSQGSLQQMQN